MSDHESDTSASREGPTDQTSTSTKAVPIKKQSNKKTKSSSEVKQIKPKEIKSKNKKTSNEKEGVEDKKKSNDQNKLKEIKESVEDKQDNDDDDDDEIVVSGGNWVHKCTVWLIDEFRHQVDLGNGNDRGLKAAAWKTVLEAYSG